MTNARVAYAKRHASASSLPSPPPRRPLRARNRARGTQPKSATSQRSDNEAVRKKLKPPPVKESPIVAWLTGAAVKLAVAKAARSLAEGKAEDVIAQVGSLRLVTR